MSATNNNPQRYAYLHSLSAKELVDLLNREVGNPHWVSARAEFLQALREAFNRKCIDYSCVRNYSGGFNLAKGNEVYLEGNRLELREGRAFVDNVLAGLAFPHHFSDNPRIRHIGTNHSVLTVSDWFTEDYDGIFIITSHGKTNTILDLSGIMHSYVLEMDFVKPARPGWLPQEAFYSATYCHSPHPGSFVQVVQSEYIVVVDADFFDAEHKTKEYKPRKP